ncbi:MAG: site-specific DNA-methyltransferase [bacterium]
MPRRKKSVKKPIEQYEHRDKERLNNPPVGLVSSTSDKYSAKTTYSYDPHLDPQLIWAGKAEHTSFEVPTVSLHVHEKIDPKTIIQAVRKKNGQQVYQTSLFESGGENLPLREAIEFYKHPHGWSNRLIAGDSLLVMNSLLEKEGMAGKVQMIYIDPPYGIKYGSNFQPFVNKRDVKDGRDEDLSQEPEMIKAYRDTWELGIHSYLTYLRDRFLIARELLTESGSIFVQISDENVHHVRDLMDEVFGPENFVSLISFSKTSGQSSELIPSVSDYLIWYCKEKTKIKYRQLFIEKGMGQDSLKSYQFVELPEGKNRKLSDEEKNDLNKIPKGSKIYRLSDLASQGYTETGWFEYEFDGEKFVPPDNRHWTTSREGLDRLKSLNRLQISGQRLNYIRYLDDFPVLPVHNLWLDTGSSLGADKIYVVQTALSAVQRCLLMTTDPGDLVLDPTCGSGTTAYVAEQWGRRWITCDTSRVAITLAKQRLMTALYDYYELAHPNEGVGSGFKYKTVPHITLKSIANDEPPGQEVLYDQPFIDKSRARVTGPFTVEAVPAPVVQSLSEVKQDLPGDESIVRQGETLRQTEWKDELFRTGIRAKGGRKIEFSRLETIPGTRWLHVDGETKEKEPKRVVVSFGPEHAPLEQKQVELALEEARTLVPKPKLVVFAAFQFDPEASKDIDETNWPGVTLLKAQMNADLLTEDLKKERTSNESFWLMGQPDVVLKKLKEGKYQVEVLGFDYYNTRTGAIESGGTDRIAVWMLDVDYDGRSLYPRQVFFPMAGKDEGWARLTKSLKAEIDQELIEAYRGTISLPFEVGEHKRIAVKIVDDRGIESLKIIYLK